MNKFFRILSTAIFATVGDVFGGCFAAESRSFGLQRNDEVVDTVNLSIFKGVVLDRERTATLLNINALLDDATFTTKFQERIARLSEEQCQSLLTLVQVRPMQLPTTSQKIFVGTPVTASFLAVTKSAFLPQESDTAAPILSAFGQAQKALGLTPSDENGLQLMLAIREVVVTRNLQRSSSRVHQGNALSMFADTNPDNDTVGGDDVVDNSNGDEDDHDLDPITLTADAAKNLSNDELKKYVTKYADKVVRTAAGKIDTVATRTALIGVTVL